MKKLIMQAAVIFLVPVIAVALVALALPRDGVQHRVIDLASMADMPQFVHETNAETQHAYRFAAANHDLVSHFPCYCGCVYMGHTSNKDCYLQDIETDGTLVFDQHAAGCGICVEITNDVARLWGDGSELDAIHEYIVATYSGRGPSTEVAS